MIGSLLLYAGLIVGLVALVMRIAAWRRRRGPDAAAALAVRRRVRMLTLLSATLIVTALVHPAPERRASGTPTMTALDAMVSTWQFDERHEIQVAAPPARVFTAIREVTAGEILFFQTLTAIRRFGRSGPQNILNAPTDRPLLDVALRSGFILLAETPPEELVFGAIVLAPAGTTAATAKAWRSAETFRHPPRSGVALAGMNFLVRPDGRGGSVVSTETRVFATDAAARWRFAIYWRVIYPGSVLIRRMWLRAIRARAERPAVARARPVE